MTNIVGPQTIAAELLHAEKYRQRSESFREAMSRIASPLSTTDEGFHRFRDILLDQRFIPAGRIQAAIGASKHVTAYNCYVSGTIADSFTSGYGSIMDRAREAAITMRMGGGIGYDFSTLRPRGSPIKKLDSQSSGAVSFISIFDAIGLATASSGHRRGAQMGVLRIDHPDIEEFIRSKQNDNKLIGFNISVAVTDEFMQALSNRRDFDLKFNGTVYKTIKAEYLWDMIMRSTYDWAEPGVLFIDSINEMNNLSYCETIAATNPCGEQPLPPYGACLLGSINLVKYLTRVSPASEYQFDYYQLSQDLNYIIPAMDKVIDIANYPLDEQEKEAQQKRRMGIGVTGLANTLETMGFPYASPKFLAVMATVLSMVRDGAYSASARLAKERGPFPLYDAKRYLNRPFIRTLRADTIELIEAYGIRNSHLLSIAPTGTISMTADNVSSGIEPVFSYKLNRVINTPDGQREVSIDDYAYRVFGTKGKLVSECTVEDHLNVLTVATRYVDSAVSKTCNVPSNISWEAFKKIYVDAWKAGCKGCTTFRLGGMRGALLAETQSSGHAEPTMLPAPDDVVITGELTCEVDPITGRKSCE